MNSTRLMRHSISCFLTFRISAFLFPFSASLDCRPSRQHNARKKLASGRYTERVLQGLSTCFIKILCPSSLLPRFWCLGPPIMLSIQWMGNFAYQSPLNYSTFILVALVALLFAFLTVAFHSLKTARTNPVESLKYE